MFAKGNGVALREQDICSGTAVFRYGTPDSIQFFLQEPCPSDVVRMAMSVHCNMEREAEQSNSQYCQLCHELNNLDSQNN